MTATMPARVDIVRVETGSTQVAVDRPRLSWTTLAPAGGWSQVRAEIDGGDGELAVVEGDHSVFVPWPFAPLAPRETRSIRVRLTGTDGATTEWSEPVRVHAAFLEPGEWRAWMIGALDPPTHAAPALLRTEFDVAADREVRSAVFYGAARGAYELEINGRSVDNGILSPGWTSYQFRLVHDTIDVTGLIAGGVNAIGLRLAGAWFTEQFGFQGNARPFYGEQPSVAGQLVIDYVDGGQDVIVTDGGWTASTDGPIRSSGIYAGESYDARAEIPGWSVAGFDQAWPPARVDDRPTPTPRISPPVRVTEERAVSGTVISATDEPILDFGQNLVGRLRITVRGERGARIVLRHAEVLENRQLAIRPLRDAAATDHYILSGDGEEVWAPAFTFHGFRFAQVRVEGSAEIVDVTAQVIHSDMPRTGWFDSSDPLLNRFHENAVWSMRGNFLSIPTDCPQRDERLGWTGDIQVFARSAAFLYDSDSFLSSWLQDLALEQRAAGGVVPFVVPNVLEGQPTPAAGWGDAATVVPWVLFERYGDRAVLRAQYDSMRDWADVLLGIAGDEYLWRDRFQFGDWLDPLAPADNPFAARTSADLVASAYLYRSVAIVGDAAEELGLADDAARYRSAAGAVKSAFQSAYVTHSGHLLSDTPTAYALSLDFGLTVSAEQKRTQGDRLAELVRSSAYHVSTGFLGTPILMDALTQTGHTDVAARLLMRRSNPSWLYPVTQGATTIWERWDSLLEDGSVNPGEMTSFNHYALGAIVDWMHRSVAGLAPLAPGYKVIRVAPHPIAQLDHAEARHSTPYGPASVRWRREGGSIVIDVDVPANTTAHILLPGASQEIVVGSGDHRWTVVTEPPARSQREPIGAETPLATIVDDEEAYDAIFRGLREADPETASLVRTRTSWTANRLLGEVLWQLPRPARDAVDEAIAELNGRGRRWT